MGSGVELDKMEWGDECRGGMRVRNGCRGFVNRRRRSDHIGIHNFVKFHS